MPYKPSRQCPGRGPYLRKCPNLIKGNESYCPICSAYLKIELKQRNKQYDQDRDQNKDRRFIHSPQWRKIRLMKLAQDSLCEICLQTGRETRAVLVHHVDENELNNPADGSNWKSVCNDCHEALHKQDRWRNYE